MAAPAWFLVATLCSAGPEPVEVESGEPAAIEVGPEVEAEAVGAEPEAIEAGPEAEPQVEAEPEVEPEPVDFVEQPASPTPASEPARPQQRRGPQPPVYGPILVTGGIGASSRSVGIGLGVTGFPIPYIGIGLDIDETVYFGDGVFNEFAATPHLWVIPLPYRSFTPFVRGGFGVDVFSHQLGVYGIWKAAGGVIIRFGKRQRVSIRGGLEVIGRVPDDKFARNFQCGLVDSPCSLRLRPEIGFGLRFG